MALSIVREITEKTPPPRAVFLRFPFGHALGEPNHVAQQMTVLKLAFTQLMAARGPGEILDSGLRWRKERYETPDWSEPPRG